jgi:hypothetical protein
MELPPSIQRQQRLLRPVRLQGQGSIDLDPGTIVQPDKAQFALLANPDSADGTPFPDCQAWSVVQGGQAQRQAVAPGV